MRVHHLDEGRARSGRGHVRIVRAASNICGIPALPAAEQRRLGHQATAALYPNIEGAAPGTVDLAWLLEGNRVTRHTRRARTIAWAAQGFDVFHFHFHATFAPDHTDVALLAALGKRIIFHLHGCDIRDPRRARSEHALSACKECPYPCMVPVKLRLPATLKRYADATLVSTPDLLEFVDRAEYLHNPVDPVAWESMRQPTVHARHRGDEWVVVHAPSNREINGARHVIAPVDRLRDSGFPVQLRIFEGLPQGELRRACAEADAIVYQVFMGWVGMFALEMMATGKPVIACIREDHRHLLQKMPVVEADPWSLAETLRQLLLSSERRAARSANGPLYVREKHDPAAVCWHLFALYGAGL